jgi:ankyrin repeat protein
MASVEPLKLLISLGFDPSIVNQSKETPLFIAARTNNIDAACVLIDNGIDCRIKNVYGKDFFLSIMTFIIKSTFLGHTAFDYILDIDEWLASEKFDEETHARLRAYKYKDIRTLMYTVSAKLDQFDARLASNQNMYLQKTFRKFDYEINKTEQEFFQSPRLQKR